MSGRIVVGVDGSPGALRALEWAVEQSRLSGASLLVVHAWHLAVLSPAVGLDEFERVVERAAEETVERELGKVDMSGIDVELRVQARGPVDALLDAARDADLLVVGTRGHGGFTGLLLGSVSQQLPHHAPCPVVIVPPPVGASSRSR
jgi:nucleotide-binding universal stress UspA family protein